MGGGLEVEEWEGRGWGGGVEVEVEMEGLKGSIQALLTTGSLVVPFSFKNLPISCHYQTSVINCPLKTKIHGRPINILAVTIMSKMCCRFFYLVRHP